MVIGKYFEVVRKNSTVSRLILRIYYVSLLSACFFRDSCLSELIDFRVGSGLMGIVSIAFASRFIITYLRGDNIVERKPNASLCVFRYHPLDIRAIYSALAGRITPYVIGSVAVSVLGAVHYGSHYWLEPAVLMLVIPYLVLFISYSVNSYCIGRRPSGWIPFLSWAVSLALNIVGLEGTLFTGLLTYEGIMELLGRAVTGTDSEGMVFVSFAYDGLAIICKIIIAFFFVLIFIAMGDIKKSVVPAGIAVLLLTVFTMTINLLNYSRIEGDNITVVKNGKSTEYDFSQVTDGRFYIDLFNERKLKLVLEDGTEAEFFGDAVTFSDAFAREYGSGKDYQSELEKKLMTVRGQ